MALPVVPAWIVDYATARDIFTNHANALQQAVAAMCAAGTMKFCGCENASFRNHPQLRGPFCQNQNCRCNLNAAIASTASALPNQLNGKKANPTDFSVKMIVACAINNNLGIVSGKSGLFLTPVELGLAHGLTCLTLDDFAAAI